jgi:histidine triad (HIT) family protein
MSCLFCAIIAGELPSRRVFEDDSAVAFLDINPWQAGHTLVVPRRHVDDLLDPDEALSEIAPAISSTARLLVDRLAADGLNLLSSARGVAGQEVFHLHVHLIPRYADKPGIRRMIGRSVDDLDQVYARISRQP